MGENKWGIGKTIILFFGFSILYGLYKSAGGVTSIIMIIFVVLFGLLGYYIKTKIFKKKK